MSFEIYSENLLDIATLNASTTNALYPVANIKDYRRSKVWRSTTASDNVVLDFGTAQDIDSFFIVGDKRSGLGINAITLQFNTTDSWGVPAHSEVITLSSEYNIGYKSFVVQSYRYCRLVVTSALAYCEISHLFLGQKQNMERSINFGWSQKNDDLSTKKANRYGQIFSDLITTQRKLTVTFNNVDKDDLTLVYEWFDSVKETAPFYVKIGCDEMIDDFRRISGMYFLNDTSTIVNPNFNKYNFSASMNEAT